MNRLAVLIALLGFAPAQAAQAAAPAQADTPAFCKSMCSSEQRQCRADAQLQPKEERFQPDTTPTNPFARTQQRGAVQGMDTQAMNAAGDTSRRLARASTCDTGYQRCVRSCAQPKDAQGLDKPKRKPVTLG